MVARASLVPTQKSIRSVGTSGNEFALLRRLASRAGVPDRQREPARREPMAEPAAGVRVELCCRRGAASGGAALIPMVEPAEDRQAHDLHPTFGSVDFPAIRCVLAERQIGAGLVVVDAIGA